MSKTNKDFWNGPLTGSRIKSEDVKLPEMLIGYFIGPVRSTCLASGIWGCDYRIWRSKTVLSRNQWNFWMVTSHQPTDRI